MDPLLPFPTDIGKMSREAYFEGWVVIAMLGNQLVMAQGLRSVKLESFCERGSAFKSGNIDPTPVNMAMLLHACDAIHNQIDMI